MSTERIVKIAVLLLVAWLLPLSAVRSAQARSTKIQISIPFPAGDERTQAYQYWADQVKERTQGRVVPTLFPGGSLMPLPQHFVALSQGSLDMGMLVSAYIDQSVPEIVILSVSGAFPPDPEGIVKTQKAIAPVMRKILEKNNILYLFGTYEGEAVINTRKGIGPLKTLDGVKGIKLRDFGPWTGEVVRRLGGSPTTLPLGEFSMALQRGTVDGAFYYWLTADALKIGEVAPYILYLGKSASWVFCGMNMDLYKSLSPEDQKIVLEVADDAAAYSAKVGAKKREAFLDPAKNKEFEISYLNDGDKATLNGICDAIKKDVTEKLPPLGKELARTLEQIP